MANKFLDDIGLSHLWDKIVAKFATKTELQEYVKESEIENPTFVVNAVGTVTADLENNIVMVHDVEDADKTVADIMAAAMSGKSVRLNLDVTDSVKEVMGLPADFDVTAVLYFDLTILTTVTDVIFSAIIDFTGSGVPVATRIQGTLEDRWYCTSVPLYPQS